MPAHYLIVFYLLSHTLVLAHSSSQSHNHQNNHAAEAAALVSLQQSCRGHAECMAEVEAMMAALESRRRSLGQAQRYISYGALKRNNVPCSRRGSSYYNCGARPGPANPYSRGCSVITHCARDNS